MAAPPVTNWQAQILTRIGAPVTKQNVLFLNDWARAEGGSASNNPFNTTQPAAGASAYNSVGVRNYGSPAQGIQATVQTLLNGRYGNIVGALKQGTDARAAAQALANSPWGTGSLVLKMLGGVPQAPMRRVTPPRPSAPLSVNPGTTPTALAARALAVLNEGNQMFGLAPLPVTQPVPSSAPPRLPTAGAAAASSPAKAPATTRPYKPPVIKGKTLRYIEHFAAPFGIPITATTNGTHAKNSYHYQGRAVDFGAPLNAQGYQKMGALARTALAHPDQWTELIYTGPGNPGYAILGGKVIPNSQLPKGLFTEHLNHVHIAR